MSSAPRGFIEVLVTDGPPAFIVLERIVRLSDIAGTKAADHPRFSATLILTDGQRLWVKGTLHELNRKINAAHADMREAPQADKDLQAQVDDLTRRVEALEALLSPEGSDNA